MVFSFTGLAELGPDKRTDLWLARVLAECESKTSTKRFSVDYVREVNTALAEAAATEFQRAPWHRLSNAHRRLAFAAAGWAYDDNGEFRSYIARLSNFHDGQDVLDAARDDWTLQGGLLAPTLEGQFFAVGTELTTDELTALTDSLRQADQSGASPDHIVYILGETIRQVAARSPEVGRSLLITSLPRPAVEPYPDSIWMVSGPTATTPTFFYVPRDDVKGVAYGPTVVTPGGGVLADFRAGSIDSPAPPESRP